PVMEDVSWLSRLGFADYSFSRSGTLVYVPGGVQQEQRKMVWVDRKGNAEPLPAPVRAYAKPSLSTDGRRRAVGIRGGQQGFDIWIYELARDALTRLTFGLGVSFAPVWTPDGKRVAFRTGGPLTTGRRSISWTPADRSAPPEQLVATDVVATP